MPETLLPSEPLDTVLAWLAGEPDDDPVADLEALRRLEPVWAALELSSAQRVELLGLLCARVKDICGRFRPRLLTATLPLERELYQPAMALIDSLLVLADDHGELLDEARRRWLGAGRDEVLVLCVQAFDLLGEVCVISAIAGAALPAGFWRRAHLLWRAADVPEDGGGLTDGVAPVLRMQYRRLLTIAVSQPEGLTARELQWLFDYLESGGGDAQLSSQPIAPDHSVYWFDLDLDDAPAPVARVESKGAGLYFSPAGITRRLGEQIAWLEERVLEADIVGVGRDGEVLDPERSGLPEGLAPVEVMSLLRRLRERWVSPPQRSQPRRKHQYSVQVCAGLKSIWEAGRGAGGRISEWMVFNESPGGYAILCVGGIDAALSAGMLIALRREAAFGWSVCIVRWIRTDRPDQVELGLQVVSQGFSSVMVGFRGADVRALSPALMLPPLTAVRQHQALVTSAGTYASRRFVLMHDTDRVYVAQGRVLGLDLQTASVELLRFEIDPYPI